MKPTGKCLEEFEQYIRESNIIDKFTLLKDLDVSIAFYFYNLTPSMQWGVLVDYFDSVGLLIEISNDGKSLITFWADVGKFQIEDEFNTRPQARKAAIEKANEIRNEQLNK